jgi:hypothetical protein
VGECRRCRLEDRARSVSRRAAFPCVVAPVQRQPPPENPSRLPLLAVLEEAVEHRAAAPERTVSETGASVAR